MQERRLRVLPVGALGTLGQAVAAELAQRHELIGAGRQSGAIRIDLTEVESIRRGLTEAGPLDAVSSAAGKVGFAPLADFVPAALEPVQNLPVARAGSVLRSGPGRTEKSTSVHDREMTPAWGQTDPARKIGPWRSPGGSAPLDLATSQALRHASPPGDRHDSTRATGRL